MLGYLARYTHRAAIANSRLVSLDDGRVRFRYSDYAAGGSPRGMQLAAAEFVRRFLLHVLPLGFVRIRHYGLLASASRCSNVELCRSLMPAPASEVPQGEATRARRLKVTRATWCERCLNLPGSVVQGVAA